MPNRRQTTAFLAATVASGLPGCSSPPASSATAATRPMPLALTPLSVISFGGGFNLPLWAARQQRLFEAHGLQATLHVTPDSKQLFSGLMDGRYQVAITAFDNIVAYQEGQGEIAFSPPSDFFAFMGSDDGFLSLVAAPEIKSFADLRGKTISVDAMTNGFSFALREMLARNGLAESDVQWARAGGTDKRFAALMQREHAATMLRAPFDLQARNRGFNTLATVREVVGPYMGIVGAARRSFAQQQPQAITGFIRAYRDALHWLRQPANRNAAEALLIANVPNMSADLARQSFELMLHPVSGFFANAQLDAAGVRSVMAMRSRLGQPQRNLTDPTRYIDERYWAEAQRPNTR